MTEGWGKFDGWCCSHGFDPLTLSAERLLNVGEFALRENRDDDDITNLDEAISDLSEVYQRFLSDPTGYRSDRRSEPLWWNEDQAGADALALAVGLGGRT